MTIKIAFLLCCVFICCGPSQKENVNPLNVVDKDSSEATKSQIHISSYNYKEPTKTFFLTRKLNEISSLAFNLEDNNFITNNDEYGHIFILEPDEFNVISEIKFGKKGDYESIEKLGDDIIISKNSGKLYFYNIVSKETESFKTALSTKNDVEGLCYEKNTHSLLMACKGQPLDNNDKKKNQKCIYAFDLAKKKLNLEPYITITDNELKSYVTTAYTNESKYKLKTLKNRVKEFAPSGIAIQPNTEDYFITSAKGSLIVIIDKNKELKEVVFLDKKKNPQPEGICFDEQNNLYISSEGQGFNGKVFKYKFN